MGGAQFSAMPPRDLSAHRRAEQWVLSDSLLPTGAALETPSPAIDSEILRAVWRALLPKHVAVEVEGYSTSAQPGAALEQAAAVAMQDTRRLEFLSGRRCARKALVALGREPSDIPVAVDRGPQWPEGIVGSITHTLGRGGGWASAAVGLVARVSALGIDMEYCDALDTRALDVVLTRSERSYLMNIPVALRAREGGLIWCAKEAALKAVRGISEPSEVEIVLSKSGEWFRASKRPELSGAGREEWAFEGRTSYNGGYAFAAAFR
jgi:4'-phosphopantetheinyl transferase EntD